ncbi:MAG: tetratricopeptide repeat protein [Chitinophagaceae bacterium]|nr:tetratricopeptide repeat protein [Chitinophagaceae bacterium]
MEVEKIISTIEDLQHRDEHFAAIDMLNGVLRNSNNYYFFFLRFRSFYHTNQLEKALIDISESISYRPSDAGLYASRSGLLMIMGRLNKALKDINIAIDIDQENGYYYATLGSILLQLHDKEMKHAYSEIKYDDLNDIVDESSDYAYNSKNNLQQSIVNLKKAIELGESTTDVTYNLGYAYYNLHQYVQSIKEFSKCLEIEQHFDSLVQRGSAYNKIGEYRNAISDFLIAIKLNHPFVFLAYNNMANSYSMMSEYEKAIPLYHKTIELKPDWPNAYCNLGRAYFFSNDILNANKYLKRALYLNIDTKKSLEILNLISGSPFLVERLLLRHLDSGVLFPITATIGDIERQCRDWMLLLEFLTIIKKSTAEAHELERVKAIVNFWMGDSIFSFSAYDNELETQGLSLQDQYYFLLSAADFGENTGGISHFAIQQVSDSSSVLDVDSYYAGKIYSFTGDWENAIAYFKRAATHLPSLYALFGIYKALKIENLCNQTALRIIELEKKSNSTSFSGEMKPIDICLPINSEELREKLGWSFFYYELTGEIQELRSYLNLNETYHRVEFESIISFSSDTRKNIHDILDRARNRAIEKEITSSFSMHVNAIDINGLLRIISNNDFAKDAILKIESNTMKFQTTFEKELAILINQRSHSPHWYAMVIKYFFLHKKISDRSGFILYVYLLKKARQNKDTDSAKMVEQEIKLWLSALSYILASHFVFRFIIQTLLHIGEPVQGDNFDQFKEYKQFKKDFRRNEMPWINELYMADKYRKYISEVPGS